MPESKFVEAGGLRIHYLEEGAGTPLILLHGGTGTAELSWTKPLPSLAETYRVIAPDTRGHGQTNNPAQSLDYAQMADDVAALVAALDLDRPLIFGYSDGGQTALEFGLRHPGKSRALVLGGVVVELDDIGRAGLKSWGFGTPGEVDFAQLEQAFGDHFQTIQAVHANWQDFLKQISRLWLTVPTYSDERLRTIAEPVLVIAGDRDELGPTDHALRLFRPLPKGELAMIPNADHGTAGSSPLFWSAVEDFLVRHSG